MNATETMHRRPTASVEAISPSSLDDACGSAVVTEERFSQLFSHLDALAAVEKKDYAALPKAHDLSIDGFRAFAGEMGYDPSLVERVLAINYPSSKRMIADLARLHSFPSAKAVQETYRVTLLDALAAAYPGDRFSVQDAPSVVFPKYGASVDNQGFIISMRQERTVESQERYGLLRMKVRPVKTRVASEVPIVQVNVGAISKEQQHEVESYQMSYRNHDDMSLYGQRSFEYRAGVSVKLLHPSSLVLVDPLERLRAIMDKNYHLVTSTHDISYPAEAFNGKSASS